MITPLPAARPLLRARDAIDARDVEIAGIAATRRATVATRNFRHFEGFGVDVVNPWAGTAERGA
ncbi:MAG: hypothetical protein ACREQM_03085 [Candidatus Dormibacteraceae bacterium]